MKPTYFPIISSYRNHLAGLLALPFSKLRWFSNLKRQSRPSEGEHGDCSALMAGLRFVALPSLKRKTPCSSQRERHLWYLIGELVSRTMLLVFGLWCLACTALLTSCSSPANSIASNSPEIKPGLILVTPDQAEHHGLVLKKPDASQPPPGVVGRNSSAVLSAPEVKAYSIGRYADPADPDLLHEAHVVYRRETPARWRLAVPPSDQILIGPRLTDQRPDSGSLQNKELDALLIDLRKTSAENRQAIELLFKAVEALTRQQQLKAFPTTQTKTDEKP